MIRANFGDLADEHPNLPRSTIDHREERSTGYDRSRREIERYLRG
jgi:hypothetical protein